MTRFPTLLFVLLIAQQLPARERPNVVVIMTDDLGFSDIGCYGGEIDTPHLDRLAEGGLRFSQFYNTAKCHSSRVSLLTGQYCLAAGDTSLNHAVTSAEVLGNGGYFTAMTGKWHLKREPTDFGFDRYFGHLSGACNFFKGDKTFRLNGQPWQVPEKDFYTTVADVEFALKFLKEARQANKPWYLYVAFNAPHAPLHALPEDYAKYKGRYDEGWDVVRAARVAKQKRIGLLPESLKASPRPEHIPAWDDLETWRQKYESNRMTTLAAMIDRVDQEIGRLVADLRSHDELDDTLFLFVSDNGACPYDRKRPLLDVEPTGGDVSLADSTGWAWARNSPFRYYKQNQFEGGIATPAIVHWPAGLRTQPGRIVHEPAHLIDVMPTLAEITQCSIPSEWPGREVRPVSGISLTPAFRGDLLKRIEPIHFLFAQDRALRDGDWKAVSFRSQAWELYNVRDDRAELHNLASSEPHRLKTMTQQWTEMARDILHASEKSYAKVEPASLPHRHPEWTNFSKTPDFSKAGGLPKPRGRRPSIRARKDTRLTIDNGQLVLDCSGVDSGIAMSGLNLADDLTGPFRLMFRLQSQAGGSGEIYFTTNAKTVLPKGSHIEFDVNHDGKWHEHSIELKTTQRIHALRLDPCSRPGVVRIESLRLTDVDGRVVKSWPKK